MKHEFNVIIVRDSESLFRCFAVRELKDFYLKLAYVQSFSGVLGVPWCFNFIKSL